MPKGIYDHKGNLGCFRKGHKVSKETLEKTRIAAKGNQYTKGRHHSEEAKKRISRANGGNRHWLYGKHHSLKTKDKIRIRHIGKKHSEITKRKLRELFSREKNPNWQGGKSFEPYSVDWTRTLRQSIRERDKYTCQICGKEPAVNAHHIDYDKKNNNPNNLIILCCSCHTKTNFNRDYWKNYFGSKNYE